MKRMIYPFTAIVGQEKMKKALLLNAINPRLGGVLIQGEKGTAKSTAVRGLAQLIPEQESVADCRYHCHPTRAEEQCSSCRTRVASGEKLPVVLRPMPVIDLPLGATEDRLIGTLDMEQAIKKGEKAFEPGILAAANRGILYVDEVNLLDDHLVDILLDAAAMGVNTVEREGVSISHPAKLILVGTMNPEEGELRPQLLDRFGLCVDVEGIRDTDARVEVIERLFAFESDSEAFTELWRDSQREKGMELSTARELLPSVTYEKGMLSMIAQICIDMGVDGHRSDITILKTAQTLAAVHCRTSVSEEDIQEAAELVLNHRMRRKPFEEQQFDPEQIKESMEKEKERQQQTPPPEAEKKKMNP